MEKLELPGDVLMPHLHIWKVWDVKVMDVLKEITENTLWI